jgi:pyruvate dehydrogenase E2 component (dihydrolipoamide acetyltransferase)
MIARKMQESLQQTAQLTYFADCDGSALQAARQAYKDQGQSVGYEDLIIEALCKILAQYPEFNALADGPEARLSSDVNVSVAVALDGGLVAPAIFNADRMTVPDLSKTRRDLVARAKAGKVTTQEMTGGTITVTNLGLTRVRHFTPILNLPQVAILGVGQLKPAVVVNDDGSIVVRPMLGLSLTTDHRFLDGEPSGRFLTALCQQIETISLPAGT